MNNNEVTIQNVDQESIAQSYFCAFHQERNEVVAIIAFINDGFSLFWSRGDLPLGIQLEVYLQAREMLLERAGKDIPDII